MSEFSATSTTSDVIAGIDLSGRQAVVTGGSSGLGEETARALASAGASVLITARSEDKANEALARLRQAVPEGRLDAVVLELSDLKQVRRAAAEVLEKCPRIDLLINNAGIMACPLDRTAEGCELQFGTNHIGHFLWTCLLVPALKAADGARIVSLSSAGHKIAGVDFDDPHFERRDYDKWVAYGQAKTANVLFSLALNKRLAGAGITANAVHPGAIITNLGRHMTKDDLKALMARTDDSGYEYKTVEQGAATSVWAATSPALEGKGGLYLEDCRIGRPLEETEPSAGYAQHALDPHAAEKLWALSEEIVGERFTLA